MVVLYHLLALISANFEFKKMCASWTLPGHLTTISTRHLLCVVSPPIMIKCTHGEHGNYDLTIIILWNDHYDFNFNVGMSDDSKK